MATHLRLYTSYLCLLFLICSCQDKGEDPSVPDQSMTNNPTALEDMSAQIHDMDTGDTDLELMRLDMDTLEPETQAPIFITTMTHLEGNLRFEGDNARRRFDDIVAKLEGAMDLFSRYDAKMTIESETPFSIAAIEYQSPIFTDILARGHGVGTHCDITPNAPRINPSLYSEEFTLRKTPMDQLIGAENNLGCSGGQGRSDWILGAHIAGFKFINGPVAFGFLSMFPENRPSGWSDDYILEEGHYHDNIPLDLADRIHPYMMADATDMEPDEDGVVLLSSGGIGRLDSMSEDAQGEVCRPMCTYDNEDVDAAFVMIEEALSLHDPTRVGKIDIYFPVNNFNEENLPYIEEFLGRLKTEYIDTGRLEWATQKEFYEAYVDWNLAR